MGVSGMLLNAVLIQAIRKHSPVSLRTYAAIFRASAFVDCAALLSMMITTTKESVFNGSVVLEFHGVCSHISAEFCGLVFGCQVYLYCTAEALLSLSFAFRYHTLRNDTNMKIVFRMILGVVVLNAYIMPCYFIMISFGTNQHAFLDEYKYGRIVETTSLTVFYSPDLFTRITLSLSIFTSIVCLILNIQLRGKTIERFNKLQDSMSSFAKGNQKMLHEALNFQLVASSIWFIACVLFSFNLLFEDWSPDFAYHVLWVLEPQGMVQFVLTTLQISNLQNITTPATNLYIIKPYRKYLRTFVHSII